MTLPLEEIEAIVLALVAQVRELEAENAKLKAMASDVRWRELADGAEFTLIDRSMLLDLYIAGATP